ncbi:MAG: phosphotransferase [Desulfobacterota bacterium]|nr:phosphotransferase [Thermodesulfobacteriota bacterium]
MIHFVRAAFGLEEKTPVELSPLEGRGSDRSFFRATWNLTDTAILIHYDPKRTENAYYADIGLFLKEMGLPVPKVYGHDPDLSLVVMEDLGETDLFSFRNAPWEVRRRLYRKTLSVASKLHRLTEKDLPRGGLKLMEGFDLDLYRWEQNYFKTHFVKNLCGIELGMADEEKIEGEFLNLALSLLRTKPCLIHRDLQSQNVMVRDGEPYLIDFQGMRFGSPFYDLASLLCDPYVGFEEGERMELLEHYYSLFDPNLSRNEFEKIFWEASAQRLMQALGAYGYLGLEKGLRRFLSYVPAGLKNLMLALGHLEGFPNLTQLAYRCRERIETKGWHR